MTTYSNLLLDLDDAGILTITLNRPQALNALNKVTVEELACAVGEAVTNPAVRALLLTGAGPKAFVAGADIAEFSQLDASTGQTFATRGQHVFSLFETCPKPTLAAVNGFALGGGCELAMACHLRVAAENARFGQPEVNLGIIPGYGGTQRLTQLVGKGRALELMLTADMVNAADALRYGLVNHVVPAEQLLEFSKSILLKILTKAPLAVRYVIDSVNALFDERRDGYLAEAENFARCCESEDFKEGPKAFLEKRPAAFTGK
jgi:enoyl-CoA hydratase